MTLQSTEPQQQAPHSVASAATYNPQQPVPVYLVSQGNSAPQLAFLYSVPNQGVDSSLIPQLPTAQFNIPVEVVVNETQMPKAVDDSQAATTESPVNDKVQFFILLVLSMLCLALVLFYAIHTPLVAMSVRMRGFYCAYNCRTPICYSSSCGFYTKHESIIVFAIFGSFAGVASLLVGCLCVLQGIVRHQKSLGFIATISTVVSALTTLFFLSGIVVFSIRFGDFWADSLIAYICAFLIHLAVLIESCYISRKIGFVAPTSSEHALMMLGAMTALLSLLVGIAGLVLIAVYSVWNFAIIPCIIFLAASISGLVGYAAIGIKHLQFEKVGIFLLKACAVLNWMIVGAGAFLLNLAAMVPVVYAIIIP